MIKTHLRAEHWFEQMLSAGVRPNMNVYNTLVKAISKAGDADRAEVYLCKMRKDGVQPNTLTYNAVLEACAGVDNAAKSWELFMDMQRVGVRPNSETFCTIARAFSRAGRWDQVDHIAKMMRESQIR